ncbi:MAG TPA: serine--tRNA ligase [Candidatus Saccharibacteria bacterium]|nr:serine--tRNA ligase [Candidatus Saccharibacteria bacterium]
MLDIQFIRDNSQKVKDAATAKNVAVDVDRLLELDEKRKVLLQEVEKLRQARNETAAQMQNGQPAPELVAEGKRIKEAITKLEAELEPTETEYTELLLAVPNVMEEDVPIGSSEEDNAVLETVGVIPEFSFTPKSDAELGLQKDLIDKERAAKIAGSRFAYLKNDLVLLQFALINFVMHSLSGEEVIAEIVAENNLSVSTNPFIPILPPQLIKTGPYQASARLNSDEMTYKLADDDLWLNASAEHSLCTMFMGETLPADQLPLRYLGYATSFRREAGTYGKDTEGIFRMHQFDKLEMESFTNAEDSRAEHDFMVAVQKWLMNKLNLPYQVVLKCSADVGKPNRRGVDIETWMPAQGAYRETHTADYIGDYQSRRLKITTKQDGNNELVHTNDATAFAMSRILKALLENNQTETGEIKVPEVLQPYMAGKTTI